MRRFLLAVVLGWSCARSVENLPRPAWVRSVVSRGGLCGGTLALDGRGDVWSEGGCENGAILLAPVGAAETAAAQRVRDAFELLDAGFECLPDPVDEEGFPLLPPGNSVSYVFREKSRFWSWSRCQTDGGEPFVTVDAAFDAL